MALSGSKEFVDMLLAREFASADDQVLFMNGCDVSGHSFKTNGFTKPVLVKSKDGLRLKVPVDSFKHTDLTRFIDPSVQVDVIDVRQQIEIQMSLQDLVDQFSSPRRQVLLNMLSLEFSKTSLSKFVHPPHVVSELSLVTTCWPEDDSNDLNDIESSDENAPSVQKYCLLSMQGSYTDFHIDFGGSSVWYHVMWGEKVFYLIPPTPEHVSAYWRWCMDGNHRGIFFPDFLANLCENESSRKLNNPTVYYLHISPGQTIFLPSGWIHAVYTPSDCLVFGGNFLNGLHVSMQLKVYRMEQKCKTPIKFLFPHFEKVHWFYSQCLLDRLTNNLIDGEIPVSFDMEAAKCLVKVLPLWYSKRRLLPLEERNYFLPGRSQLDMSCPNLIERLSEIVNSTLPHSMRNSGFLENSSKLEIFSKHSKSNEQNIKRCSNIESIKCLNHELVTNIKGGAVGGLGWMPTRHAYSKSLREPKSLTNENESGEHMITDDANILEALPGLEKSRLIGDHYYFTLSDLESDDDDNNAKMKSKSGYSLSKQKKETSATYSVSKRRKTKNDDDPTWSMPGLMRHRFRTTEWKSKSSGLAISNIKRDKTSLHPLLSEASASSSSSHSSTLKRGDTSTSRSQASTVTPQKLRSKHNTTVRQRLAKRLGI
ncbi:Lysine-specific demethylase 7A [Schistosoma japonicum]|nr:Lysine-specific demethylase 7A [Schistosoma japonicum]